MDKDVFKHNHSPRKGEKQPIIALSISQTSDDAPRNVSSEFVQPGMRSTLPPTRGGGQTSSPPSKTPKTNPVKWRLPKKKSWHLVQKLFFFVSVNSRLYQTVLSTVRGHVTTLNNSVIRKINFKLTRTPTDYHLELFLIRNSPIDKVVHLDSACEGGFTTWSNFKIPDFWYSKRPCSWSGKMSIL